MAPLPLSGLNHVSRVCRDVATSAQFYSSVLGFTFIKRPSSFDFEGAWLFGFGIGIHLIKGEPIQRSSAINPRADHLSFQACSLADVEVQLQALGVEYVQAIVEEDGIRVSQLFFHDPDNNMIEICNCDLLPVVPLSDISAAFCTSCHAHDLISHHHQQQDHHVSHSAMSISSSQSGASISGEDLFSSFTFDSGSNCGDGGGGSHGGSSLARAAVMAAATAAAASGGMITRGPSSGSMSRSKSMVNFRVVTPGQRGF